MKLATTDRATGKKPTLDRAKMLAAVRSAFVDVGASASMHEIAQSSGIGVATLRQEFGERDALVTAVLDDILSVLRDDRDDGDQTPRNRKSRRLRRPRLRHAVPPLAVLAALLPVGASPSVAAAASEPVPIPGPSASVLTVSPLWPVMPINGALSGSMCATNTCAPLQYVPFMTGLGVAALNAQLSDTTSIVSKAGPGDPTVVFAFSNGAVVAQKWMEEHAGDPTAPSPDQLSFVFIGNPRRAYGGSLPVMPPSDYPVIDIVQQYDPVADFPDHPNLLALLNIAAGNVSPLHLDYSKVDLQDPNNVVWTEGNTTYVFVPTENLPLLAPLRMMGMTKLADELNAPLKKIVEQAYDRPYLPSPTEPAVPANEPTASTDSASTRTLATTRTVAAPAVQARTTGTDTTETKTAGADTTETAPADADTTQTKSPTETKPARKWGVKNRADNETSSSTDGSTDSRPARHRWGAKARAGSDDTAKGDAAKSDTAGRHAAAAAGRKGSDSPSS
ncbi:transcriptional regulator [Mycolicibacterium chubuense NBB4]|uniref:Transcriptional regulator n=1 Tax=Mycolicibacterium chubuense (strain NBB4) TaxID=710421 RepID=I4BQ68_MYCCN|nr:PE-PPE domain-containing protein [Mycolicibacterium chubuense]AFM19425.1 transcriptional regulator [Mycolicibacterium chubuense NBB4]